MMGVCIYVVCREGLIFVYQFMFSFSFSYLISLSVCEKYAEPCFNCRNIKLILVEVKLELELET